MSDFFDPDESTKFKPWWQRLWNQYPWVGKSKRGLAPTFKVHMNQQNARMVLPLLLMCCALWVPYMEHDLKHHARPWFAYWTRVLPTAACCTLLITYLFSVRVRRAGTVMLTIISALLLSFEVLTMASANFDPIYVSSFYLAMLLPVILPLPVSHTWSIVAGALLMVLISLFFKDWFNLDIGDNKTQGLMDLVYAYAFAFLVPYMNHRLRKDLYEKSKENLEQKLKLDVLLSQKTQQYDRTFSVLQHSMEEAEQRRKDLLLSQRALQDISLKHSQETHDLEQKILDHLHDNIGQNLVVGRLKLNEILNSSLEDGLEKELEKVLDFVDRAISDTRQVMSDLCSKMLQELGLLGGIKELIKEARMSHEQEVAFICDEKLQPPSEPVALLLLRATQELLHNAHKYACGAKVFVSYRQRNGMCILTVRDQGPGFDESAIRMEEEKGFGLLRLKTMSEAMGGQLSIERTEEIGVAVVISLPL